MITVRIRISRSERRDTHRMPADNGGMDLAEGIALMATTVSAAAAAIGAYVSYAQWKGAGRGSRARAPNVSPAGPPATDHAPRLDDRRQRPDIGAPSPPATPLERDSLARGATAAAILGTLACTGFAVFFVIALFGAPVNALTKGVLYGALGAAIATTWLGLRVLIRARRQGRPREARTAKIALAMAVSPWVLLYAVIAVTQLSE